MNHFYSHWFISSKIGLTESLKALPRWNNKLEMDAFYPRCFILHSNDRLVKVQENSQQDPMYEWDAFQTHFRMLWAESILKRHHESGKVRLEKVLIALNVNEQRLWSFDELMEIYGEVKEAMVLDAEWEVLQMSNK